MGTRVLQEQEPWFYKCYGPAVDCIRDNVCRQLWRDCDDATSGGQGAAAAGACDSDMEWLRQAGCCDNKACTGMHDCLITAEAAYAWEPTCDEWRWQQALPWMIVVGCLLLLSLVAWMVCCCSSKDEVQVITVEQQALMHGPQVVMAVQTSPAQPVFVAQLVDAPSAPQLMHITVPPGVEPGQTMQVSAPSGLLISVVVPEGAAPDSTFTVEC